MAKQSSKKLNYASPKICWNDSTQAGHSFACPGAVDLKVPWGCTACSAYSEERRSQQVQACQRCLYSMREKPIFLEHEIRTSISTVLSRTSLRLGKNPRGPDTKLDKTKQVSKNGKPMQPQFCVLTFSKKKPARCV